MMIEVTERTTEGQGGQGVRMSTQGGSSPSNPQGKKKSPALQQRERLKSVSKRAKAALPKRLTDPQTVTFYSKFALVMCLFFGFPLGVSASPSSDATNVLVGSSVVYAVFACVCLTISFVLLAIVLGLTIITKHARHYPMSSNIVWMVVLLSYGFSSVSLAPLLLACYIGILMHFGRTPLDAGSSFLRVCGHFTPLVSRIANSHVDAILSSGHHLAAVALQTLVRLSLYSTLMTYWTSTPIDSCGIATLFYLVPYIIAADATMAWFFQAHNLLRAQVEARSNDSLSVRALRKCQSFWPSVPVLWLSPNIHVGRVLVSVVVNAFALPTAIVMTHWRMATTDNQLFQPEGYGTDLSFVADVYSTFSNFVVPRNDAARLTMWGCVTGLGTGALWELLLEELATLAMVWRRTDDVPLRADKIRSVMLRIIAATGDKNSMVRVLAAHERIRQIFPAIIDFFTPPDPTSAYTSSEEDGAHQEAHREAQAYDDRHAGLNDYAGSFQPEGDGGAGTFDSFMNNLSALSHHRNAKDFVIVSGILVSLFAYMGGKGSNEFELDAAIKVVKDWAKDAGTTFDVIKSVNEVANLVARCFKAMSFAPLFDSTNKFTKWQAEVKDYVSLVQNYASQTTVTLAQIISKGRDLVVRGNDISLDARSVGGKYYLAYADHERLLNTAIATMHTRYANSCTRQEPLGVMLHGPPGIGKSFMTDFIHSGHCIQAGIEDSSSSRFTFAGDTDFMDGLTSNAITFVLDDVGKNSPKAIPMDMAIRVIIGVINSTAYTPNMASLEDKGKIIFEPKLVIATTNKRDLNARNYLATPDAVWRRFPFVVEPRVKKEFRAIIDGVETPKLDLGKAIKPEQGYADWWDFEVYSVCTQGSNDPTYSLANRFSTTGALVRFINSELDKKKVAFSKVTEITQTLAKASSTLCKVCFEGLDTCNHLAETQNVDCDGYIARQDPTTQGELKPESEDPISASTSQTSLVGGVIWFCVAVVWWCVKLYVYFVYYIIVALMWMNVLGWCLGLVEVVMLYFSAIGAAPEHSDATISRIISWTLYSQEQRAKQLRDRWVGLAKVSLTIAVLYGLSKFMKAYTFPSAKVAEDDFIRSGMSPWMLRRQFVSPTEACSLKQEAMWPTEGKDTPCVWRKDQFERATVLPEYSRTSSPEDVITIVHDKQVYMTFHTDQGCSDSSHITGVHGLFLDNTTVASVTHTFTKLKQYKDIWMRVYLKGGVLPVTRKFDPGYVYQSPHSPEISAYRLQVTPPGVLVRDDPNKTPFVGADHRALSSAFMHVTGAYMTTKNGSTVDQGHIGHVLGYKEADFSGAVGPIVITSITKTAQGMCGTPLYINSGGKVAVAGLHIGRVGVAGDEKGVAAHLTGPTAVDLVSGLDRVVVARDGGLPVSDPLSKCFRPGEPAMRVGHSLVDSTANAPFNAQWLIKECDPGKSVRVLTYGTILGPDGSVFTSGVGGKSPVCDTPFRDVAEELGYSCDKAGPKFTNTHKTMHLKKIDDGLHSPPATMLNVAARCVLAKWQAMLRDRLASTKGVFYGTRLLSYEEAVNGIEGCTYFDKLNMKTSMGYPWCTQKSKCFQVGEGGKFEIPSSVMDRIVAAEAAYDRGELAGHIFTASFKHEPMSPEKIASHKARVIYAGPVDYSIMMRRHFGSLMVHLQNNQDIYGSYVGTNPESYAWSKLFNRLNGMGQLFAGDYSGYDTSAFSSHMMQVVFGMIISLNTFLNGEGFRPDGSEPFSVTDINRMWGIAGDTSSPYINFFGEILLYESLNPSGHALTTPFNGVGNVMLIVCAFINVMHEHEGLEGDPTAGDTERYVDMFFECVRAAVYGDDHVIGTSDSRFTFAAFKTALAKFGVKVTTADSTKSDGDYDFIQVEELDFLKRGFVWDEEYQVHKAPLRKEVIHKMFCVWVTKPGENEDEHVSSILRAIDLAASQHDREFHATVRSHINTIIERKGYSSAVLFGASGLPTYDQYMNHNYNGVPLADYVPPDFTLGGDFDGDF